VVACQVELHGLILTAYDQGVPPQQPGQITQATGAVRPTVELGTLVEGGLAPAILAVVDRGVQRRPAVAAAIRGEVELSSGGQYPPVRILFAGRRVVVEDGPAAAPDLRITGALPDLISLMVAPLVRGVPSPVSARGRAAIGLVAFRRVRIEGRFALTRRFLALIAV
jgi:hypothetical protein